ncbi:hypothetical protein D9M69_322410 [compost metagenome]
MPGAYKVLIFFLIQKTHNLTLLGNIASWQSIAQIIGYFTAIGWSSLILVRVSKTNSKPESVRIFNQISTMSALTLCACSIAILTIGLLLKKTEDAIQICLWLSAWTLYQIPRHYLIALREYRRAIYLDIGVIGCSLLALTAPEEDTSALLAISMLTAGAITFILIQNGKNTKIPPIKYEFKGIEFGLVNLLSGGISLSLVPLASYFEGKDFAGTISLFISISAIALLIPRAISLNQLPKLTKLIGDPQIISSQIPILRRQINLSNIFTTIICTLIISCMTLSLPNTYSVLETILVFTLITLQNTISTASLLDANLLMAKERSACLLKINIHTSATYITLTAGLYLTLIDHAFLYLCFFITALNFYRLYKTRSLAKSIYDCHTAI